MGQNGTDTEIGWLLVTLLDVPHEQRSKVFAVHCPSLASTVATISDMLIVGTRTSTRCSHYLELSHIGISVLIRTWAGVESIYLHEVL